jgi:hypothetical protein
MSKQDITIVLQQKVLSKEQQKFNTLISKLDAAEREQVTTSALTTSAETQAMKELLPLEDQIEKTDLAFLLAFDKASRGIKFSKKVREGVDAYMLEKASNFMQAGLEEARPMYDYYSDQSFEEEKEEINAMKRAQFEMMANLHGMDLEIPEDMDFSDPEQLRQFMHKTSEKAKAKMEEQAYQAKTKKKTAPKSKKQAEKELEETELQKLKRGIYMELVKRYHPDKYQDETERNKATETMQRITAAYDADDLLALFKLQLELGTALEAQEIQNLAENQLKSVNKTLETKLRDLQKEISGMKEAISELFDMRFNKLTKEVLELAFRRKKRQMMDELVRLEQNTRRCSDEKYIKKLAAQMAEEMNDEGFDWW